MARYGKLKSKVFINDGDKVIPVLEMDEDGKVTMLLPEEKLKEYTDKMLDNIGKNMSEYIMNHPESALWGRS